MKLCESSLVHSFGYHAASKMLWIRVQHERRLYRYPGVPENVVEEMARAPSIGSYVTRNILKQYKGERVEEKT